MWFLPLTLGSTFSCTSRPAKCIKRKKNLKEQSELNTHTHTHTTTTTTTTTKPITWA
jgi:hypothetical protein